MSFILAVLLMLILAEMIANTFITAVSAILKFIEKVYNYFKQTNED